MPTAHDMSIVRFADLEPSWHVPGAKVPGTMRSLISWVGGPRGYINSNPGFAVENEEISVGMMYLPVAQRQQGLHYHTITEIYIICKGYIESYDGSGDTQRLGPLDCISIPPGVPHGVRNIGSEDVELIWLHDGVEAKGLTVYCQTQKDIENAPSREPIRVVSLADLEPFWDAPKAKEPEFLRYIVNWIGGPAGFENYNRQVAVESTKITLGLTVILPGHKQVHHEHDVAEVYVILRGKALVRQNSKNEELGYLDSVYFPAGRTHALRNHGSEPVFVMWAYEKSNAIGGTRYDDDKA